MAYWDGKSIEKLEVLMSQKKKLHFQKYELDQREAMNGELSRNFA